MTPIINKPTRVINKTAAAIDYILTTWYTETIFKRTILKGDVWDHFPICLIILSLKMLLKNKVISIFKRSFNEQFIISFKNILFKIYCQEIETLQKPRDAYTYLLEQFSTRKSQDKIQISIRSLNQRLRITNGIKKSSKRKQRLYN